MDDVGNCFDKKLLIRSSPSSGLARKSVKQARIFLADAEDMVKFGKERMGIIALYSAFFHAARSLLFRDGIRERSHYCVARYVEGKYVNAKAIPRKFMDCLDLLRDMRHDTQYSLGDVTIGEDLEEIAEICKEFISIVERLLV